MAVNATPWTTGNVSQQWKRKTRAGLPHLRDISVLLGLGNSKCTHFAPLHAPDSNYRDGQAVILENCVSKSEELHPTDRLSSFAQNAAVFVSKPQSSVLVTNADCLQLDAHRWRRRAWIGQKEMVDQSSHNFPEYELLSRTRLSDCFSSTNKRIDI